MASTKISQFSVISSLAAADYFPVIQNSDTSNKRIPVSQLFTSLPAGSAASPSLSFSDANTGLYSPGADQVAISTNGAGRLFVDSSGRVGIGTASPSVPLQVQDDLSFSLVRVVASSSSVAGIDFGDAADTDTGGVRYDNVTDSMAFRVNASERARIDSSGRLLVGTSSARTVGAAAVVSQIETTGGDAGLSIVRNSNTATGGFVTLAKTRGTSLGSSTIVQSGDTLGGVTFAGADGTDLLSIAARIEAAVDGTPGTDDMPGRLVFSTTADGASSPTERMRISNAGVTNAFSSSTNVLIARSASAAGTTDNLFSGAHSATSTTTGTFVFFVKTNGDVQNTNNAYGAISDIKLKENVVDANSQWSDIKALQVRNYNFKEGQTHTQIGLIAQEVELVSPGLVGESPDLDEDGNDLGTTTKSVNYSVLYMKAVKALQEAMERIETLEAKVAALETP